MITSMKTDEERAGELAKQMTNLDQSQVLQILQTVEQSALEFSIPLLMPLLSLQVKLSLSKDIFAGLDSSTKTEMVRESIIDSLVNDITDIAILQEVIDRSQEKLNNLTEHEPPRECWTQSDLEMKDASTLTDKQVMNGPHTIEIEDVPETMAMKDIEEVKQELSEQYVYKTMDKAQDSTATKEKKVIEELMVSKEPKDNEKSTDSKDASYQEETKNSENDSVEDKSEEDSGVDTEEAHIEVKISKSKSEKNIKKSNHGHSE